MAALGNATVSDVQDEIDTDTQAEYKDGTHTNKKYTGQIYPRLYDWTGDNYGTFR